MLFVAESYAEWIRYTGLYSSGELCRCVSPCHCGKQSHSTEPCDCPQLCVCPQPCHCPESESLPKEHPISSEQLSEVLDGSKQTSISEPSKSLPTPKITIQRPTDSDLGEFDDPEPSHQTSPRLKLCIIDGALVKQHQGTGSLEHLEEERRITSELTRHDHESIVQHIAAEMGAVSSSATEVEEQSSSVHVKVKMSMRIRRKVVRRPVLKLMLGRQLAGPTREALERLAQGKRIPMGDSVV